MMRVGGCPAMSLPWIPMVISVGVVTRDMHLSMLSAVSDREP